MFIEANCLNRSPHVCRELPCDDWVLAWYDVRLALFYCQVLSPYIFGQSATTTCLITNYSNRHDKRRTYKYITMQVSNLLCLLGCVLIHEVTSDRPNPARTNHHGKCNTFFSIGFCIRILNIYIQFLKKSALNIFFAFLKQVDRQN